MANLMQYLTEKRFVVPLKSTRKRDAIREVASTLEGAREIPDFRRFLSALFRKESRFGSGVDRGVSLPHYRDESVLDPVIGIGVSPDGVEWDKRERVHILVLICWPDKHEQAYLHTVADIARTLHKEEARVRLIRSGNPAKALEAIRSDLAEAEGIPA